MSFPRYPKYKDSGVEWLGQVPEHWENTKLRYVCQCLDGQRIPLNAAQRFDKQGGIPYWGANSIVDYVDEPLFDEDLVLLGEDGAPFFDRTKPVAFFTQGKVWPNNHVHVLRPNASGTGKFITNILNITDYAQFIDGSTRDKLTQGSMNDIPVPWPSLPEQTAIAAFLDREAAKTDALVAEQQRLMELLKEKRQAVISHAVTKGLNPNAPMKPSGIEWLGEVPQSWTVTKLGRAVFMQEGPGLRHWQFTDEGTRVICVTNITDAGIDFTRLEKFISTEEYHSSYRHFTVRRGDVLLSSSGNSWGKVAIYEGEEDVILNTSTIRLNESEGAPLNRDSIAMLLQSDTVREQLGLAMTGSCQPNFGPSHLNSVMVAIPSRAEQSAIVKHLSAEIAKIDTLTAESQRAIGLLQERRTALISAAVTGQIDVRKAIT